MKRLDFIDEMKGFAILLVTMGHVFLPNTQEGQMHPVAQMIYSFHMSFFFFLSGFMLAKTHKLGEIGERKFIQKKLQTLIVPWLSFCLVVPAVLHRGMDVGLDVRVLIFFPIGLYWFLPLLFIFMMLWLTTKKATDLLRKKNATGGVLLNGIVCCIAAVVGVVSHEYFAIIYAIYYASFIFGYMVSDNESLSSQIMRKSVWGVCALILIITWKLGPIDTHGGIAWRSMLNLIYDVVCSITACIVFFNIFRNIELPYGVKRFLQETGKLSLAIYLIPVHVLPSGFLFPADWTPAFTSIAVLGISVFINGVRYWIGRAILEIPYLRFILLGKK